MADRRRFGSAALIGLPKMGEAHIDPLPPVTTGRFAALKIASALGRGAHPRNSPSAGPAVLPFGPSAPRALYFLIPQRVDDLQPEPHHQ